MDAHPYVSCPFCQETDFDLEGLKAHFLKGWCEKFNEIEAASLHGNKFRGAPELGPVTGLAPSEVGTSPTR